jgi:hypothetical protein
MLVAHRTVFKSLPVDRLNKYFSGSGPALTRRYELALAHIDSGKSLAGITALLAGGDEGGPSGLTADDVSHFRQDWLGDRGWAAGADVENVMRYGYREAIQLAMQGKSPLPIETLWVTGTGGVFELYVNEGDRQVTVLVFVPTRARKLTKLPEPTGASKRTFVVRADDGTGLGERLNRSRKTPIVKLQVSGPGDAKG